MLLQIYRGLATRNKKLTQFLNCFNGLHNKIYFTVEKAGGHLPFLHIDVYRKTDGSLGHESISNSPTQISFYTKIHIAILQTISSLFPDTQNQSSQWPGFLHKRTVILTIVFKDDVYSPKHIWRVLKPASWTAKTNSKSTSLYSFLTPWMYTADSAEYWQITPSKLSPFHQGKSAVSFHLSRMSWDYNSRCIQHHLWGNLAKFVLEKAVSPSKS